MGISANLPVRYGADNVPWKTGYMARHLKYPQQAARALRRQGSPEKVLALINNLSLPVQRGVKILHQFFLSGDIHLLQFLFQNVRWEILDGYMQKYKKNLAKCLSSGSLTQKTRAVLAMGEFVDFLTPKEREVLLSSLDSVPTRVQLGPGYYLDHTYLIFSLRLRIKSVEIMEKLEELMAILQRAFPLDQEIGFLITHNLEFVPSEEPFGFQPYTKERVEKRVGRSLRKRGHAVQIMASLMRSPKITADEIQRLTETSYCSKPYGEAAPYRKPEDPRILRGVTPELVPAKMKHLVEWVNSERARRLHPLKRAAVFYARYDQIHPFYKHPWGYGTKHAARFFAAKIMLQGKNGIIYPPLIDDIFFMVAPIITKRPSPYKGRLVLGEDPFGSLFGKMLTLQKLIEDQALDEYLFNFLAIYLRQLKIFLYIHGAPEVPEAKTLMGELTDLFLSECKPETRDWFGAL